MAGEKFAVVSAFALRHDRRVVALLVDRVDGAQEDRRPAIPGRKPCR